MTTNRLRRALLAAGVAGMVCAWAGGAAAQDGEADRNPRVGVVDLQEIMRESTAANEVRAEVEAQQAAYREEISTRESQLREQQAELERQRTILAADAFAEREAEFARAVEALQREVGERNRTLEEQLAYGMQQVQVGALRVIAEIAEEMSLGLVLDKSQLLLVAKGLEFSDRVIARLNEEMPSAPAAPPPPEDAAE